LRQIFNSGNSRENCIKPAIGKVTMHKNFSDLESANGCYVKYSRRSESGASQQGGVLAKPVSRSEASSQNGGPISSNL